jgi:hypothetical protein
MTSEKGIAPSDFNRACESLLVLNHRSIYSSAEALALGDSSPRRARTHHVLSLPELSLSTRLLTPTRRVPASAALLLWLIQVDDEGEGCGEIILCRTTFVAHDRMCGSFAPTCVISLSLSAIGGRLDLGARVRIAPWRPTSLHPYITILLYPPRPSQRDVDDHQPGHGVHRRRIPQDPPRRAPGPVPAARHPLVSWRREHRCLDGM